MFFTSYFIDVDSFYLFLNWFSTRVSEDRKYVCGRRLYACINTRKFKYLDSREITSLPKIQKVIYMARHFNHRRKKIACSSQDPFVYNKSFSLRGRRSKGKGKGIRARDHARERRVEGNACKETIVFAIPPTNWKNNKNNATVND